MAESTMEEVVNVEGELKPCGICGRTFLPEPLAKHMRVCERNATRKRKIFNSLKQRVEGTELAPFHQKSYIKKNNTSITPEAPRQSSKWREKHLELVSTIRAARGVPEPMPSSPKRGALASTSGGERCPSCDRVFGPRAYDRHVEWCKEHKARIQRSPAEVLLAKERLEARTKYRVPLPNRSKRTLIRDKYCTVSGKSDSTTSLASVSSSILERSPSVRKPKPVHNLKRVPEDVLHEHDDVSAELQSKCEKSSAKQPAKTKSVPKEAKKAPATEPIIKSDKQSDYNPFVTAERQLMELLECDDFKPFVSNKKSSKHTQRPHTTANTSLKPIETKNNKVVKSAEAARKKLNPKSGPNSKRSSVIDPPMDFQDKLNLLSDDFELIESLINQNYIDGYDLSNDFNFDSISSKLSKHFFLESDANDNERCTFAAKERKYSDDMSSIDPRLINENDNLLIPDNLKVDDYSSHSSNDNLMPAISKVNKKSEPKRVAKGTTLEKMAKSFDEPRYASSKNAKQTNQSKKTVKGTQQTANVHKSTASLTSSVGATRSKLNTDKKKNLSTLKRSVSLLDPVQPKNLKSKEDVQNYFNQHEKKSSKKSERTSPERQMQKTKNNELKNILTTTTAEELFTVDDEMYEEYKKYEEMYLREKQQQMQKEKKPDDVISSGTLTPNEGSDNVPPNVKVSADSAYSSLNRKAPKVRARSTKLAPLERQLSPTGSPTSSGSDTSPSFFKQSAEHRLSKFCHECGNKYPINTAKFCVECGVRRLVL